MEMRPVGGQVEALEHLQEGQPYSHEDPESLILFVTAGHVLAEKGAFAVGNSNLKVGPKTCLAPSANVNTSGLCRRVV